MEKSLVVRFNLPMANIYNSNNGDNDALDDKDDHVVIIMMMTMTAIRIRK